jgi:hypothetical protein
LAIHQGRLAPLMGVKGKDTFVAASAGKEETAKKSSNRRVAIFCFIQLSSIVKPGVSVQVSARTSDPET